MKKLLLSFLLVFPLCGFAQKGMQGIGGGVIFGFGDLWSYSPSVNYYFINEGRGVTLKYEYNLFDRVGVASNISILDVGKYEFFSYSLREISGTPDIPSGVETVYELVNDYATKCGEEAFLYGTAGLDLRFFINEVRLFRTYVFCGIDLGMSFNSEEFLIGLRSGLGFNWRLGYNCSLQLELPINLKWSGFFFSESIFSSDGDEAIYCVGGLPYGLHGLTMDKYFGGVYYDSVWAYGTGYRTAFYIAFTPTISIVYNF